MKKLSQFILAIVTSFSMHSLFAAENIVNVYTWSQEIPHFVIEKFEKETGIKVHYSTFDSNEVMYTKLRAAKNPGYDLVEPSSYYIDRMRHQGMLQKLDRAKLDNYKNLDPLFLNQAYDPQSEYSVPFIWGITGIFVNKNYFSQNGVTTWNNLLDKKYLSQLMFLDDAREVFSTALLMLGYSINDKNPEHIKEAYLKLKSLMPNVKLFNTDAIISLLIDEDATAGMSWNADLYKASKENPNLRFIYPSNGFEIWVDNFALLKSAPHTENAYRFLNFLMRPEIAMAISLNINYSTANLAAKNLLPAEIKNNPALYPSADILRHGEFETDIGDTAFGLFEKYWEQLKMGA
ncbi:MAG: spermidine/putrescine ABC transporter substrate-binding protein [Gammaproteobacteria bacterium]|nr:spermidine/putrescine ABC transporter substrate-binding protein [Gammaproteobacteria bacterium]